MASAFLHMQDDMSWLAGQDGESFVDVAVTVAGITLPATIRAIKQYPGDGMTVTNGKASEAYEELSGSYLMLSVIPGTLPEITPGRAATVDGVGYEVFKFTPGSILDHILFAGNQG